MLTDVACRYVLPKACMCFTLMVYLHEYLTIVVLINYSNILNRLQYFTHYQQGNKDLHYHNFIKPKVGNITLKPNPGKPGFNGLGKPGWLISCQPCQGACLKPIARTYYLLLSKVSLSQISQVQ